MAVGVQVGRFRTTKRRSGMKKFKILILNGPNLGHIGRRQPEIYGSETMDMLSGLLGEYLGADAENVELVFEQSNSEGRLIDVLEGAREQGVHGAVLNAGAYTHTSLALADCLAWIDLPVVEVHLSNIWARSEARHKSLTAGNCAGVVAGFGLDAYALAVVALTKRVLQKG
jgi:3-dehydroquinate dehydratase-2